MLQDLRRLEPSTRSSERKLEAFKIIALIAVAVLALMSVVSSEIAATGDWEYPTILYGP